MMFSELSNDQLVTPLVISYHLQYLDTVVATMAIIQPRKNLKPTEWK